MITLVLSALLGPWQAPLQEEPIELKVYPVAGLTRSAFVDSAMSMFPLPWTQDAETGIGLDSEPYGVLEPDVIVELLRMSVYPEVWDWHPDASIDYLDSGRLVVRAPASVQEEIARRLRFLEDQFTTRAHLVARVYQGRLGKPPSVLMSPAEADALLGQATERGVLSLQREVSVPLSLVGFHAAENMTTENLPFYWEIELAQASYIGSPILLVVGHGLRLEARPAPVGGGVLLDLLLRQSEKVAEDRWTTPDSMQMLAQGDAVMGSNALPDSPGRLGHPVTGFTSFAGSALLPQGKVLWIHTHTRTATGEVPFLIDLRLEGALPQQTAAQGYQLLGDPEDSQDDRDLELRVLHTGSITRGGAEPPPIGPDTFDLVGYGPQWEPERCTATAGVDPTPTLDIDILTDLVMSSSSWFETDEWAFLQGIGPSVILSTPPDQGERILAPLQPFLSDLGSFQVRGTVRREGQAVAEFTVPLVQDRLLGLWSGVQTPALAAWSAEVANNVSLTVPRYASIVDGYALNLRVDRSLQGSFELVVRGKLNFLQRPAESLDLHGRDLPFDHAVADTLFVDDVRPLDGQTPLRFGDQHLSLELVVTAQR